MQEKYDSLNTIVFLKSYKNQYKSKKYIVQKSEQHPSPDPVALLVSPGQ